MYFIHNKVNNRSQIHHHLSTTTTAMDSSGELIMASLLHLSPAHFSALTRSLSSDLRQQQHRLLLLVISPSHFSETLAYLHSLSLPSKTLLLARLLLRCLRTLLLLPDPHSLPHRLRLHELDAALLLFSMCEVYQPGVRPSAACDWRTIIARHLARNTLTISGLGAHRWAVVAHYVDAAVKCKRLLDAVNGGGGRGRKMEREVGAAVAAVVALPSTEVGGGGGGGRECVVCKEEMEVGRDVCRMPCGHLFHWMCIMRWLSRRNTCPCCRFQLPTDDVFYEIDRLWRQVAVNASP